MTLKIYYIETYSPAYSVVATMLKQYDKKLLAVDDPMLECIRIGKEGFFTDKPSTYIPPSKIERIEIKRDT
jgi:hypothetical protein